MRCPSVATTTAIYRILSLSLPFPDCHDTYLALRPDIGIGDEKRTFTTTC